MRVAFVGKGGSGKTTIAGLFARVARTQGIPVLAIDADLNQHLLQALGADVRDTPPPLGGDLERIKTFVRGENPRIKDSTSMIKTTPPGAGSTLLRPFEKNALFEHFARDIDGVRFLATGPFQGEDVGTKCYHSKTGAVELLLAHTLDRDDELIVVDMTAGADAFASGLFTAFDVTFVVTEPTIRSHEVYLQYREHALPFGITISVVGNKITEEDDHAFLVERVGSQLACAFPHSSYVRQMEKQGGAPISSLPSSERTMIETLITRALGKTRDWEAYRAHTHHFHRLNAQSWGNLATGLNLEEQIDPLFTYPTP